MEPNTLLLLDNFLARPNKQEQLLEVVFKDGCTEENYGTRKAPTRVSDPEVFIAQISKLPQQP